MQNSKFRGKSHSGQIKVSIYTDAWRELHILPVSVCIEYKILLMVFKCLHGLAPSYMSELISITRCSYNTRAAAKNLVVILLTHKKIFANRSLSVAGPKRWNVLPDHLRYCNCLTVCQKNLKTYLFYRASNLQLMFNYKYYYCTAPLNTVSRNDRSTSGINLNLSK